MTQSTLMQVQAPSIDLEQLNRKLGKAYPKEILTWCKQNLPTGLVQTSAFSVDDLVITDLLYRRLKPALTVPVLFVDTLHHFPETLELVDCARLFYGLDLKVYRSRGVASYATFARKYGEKLWENNLEKFNRLTRQEPLQRGLEELSAIAWITGRKKDPISDKPPIPVFEWDERGRLKINPLANWSRTESWAYVYEHDMLYNPLYDRGYSHIGDEPFTQKVEENLTEPIEVLWESTKKMRGICE
ncbi:phosphoadenylyl-sulfate reductase [Lusitaniella coriacea LEGE 07157]|uniref:Phosphoadenylyl-sulfate reductase n=1 Tax=Lusitaniella coriacea LEGE 07157 TaxID=945747 RepID=A0A8J7DWD9_9CYAN|nr:phosphoadenylyl-sulfate reductase [Lusitaniella coriacea]MBE9116028.1 phosphoadenylyl-sulfate reductase [Lusitaniella coriacea LEGE 07157]